MPQFDLVHAGYLHQDLLAACALARLHLAGNTDVAVFNDAKTHTGDKFDDLRTSGAANRNHQIKWHEDVARPLGVPDLSTKKISFRIDDVLAGFLAGASRASEYRLLTTCSGPDANLSSYLVEDSSVPPSSPGLGTRRFRLSAVEVWPETGSPRWSVLGNFDRQDFADFCDVFVIETTCPRGSHDLRAPGDLERHLLALLADELGIGRFPNTKLTPVDAAAHLIHLAAAARADKLPRDRADVRRALDLQVDFGRVPEVLPVDPSRLVPTPDAIESLVEQASGSKVIVVRGAPGSGKSWLLEGLRNHLISLGELAVAHYCFVHPDDQEQQRRAVADVLFGSLIAELHDLDGRLVTSEVPRYAAGPRELEGILAKAVEVEPDRQITLIVDGLDHADRLPHRGEPLALRLAQELAELNLPNGVRLVIGSQAGQHLEPLRGLAVTAEVRLWPDGRISELALQAGLCDVNAASAHAHDVERILDAICEKSKGNPLYATYLSRTALGIASGEIKPRADADVVEHLLRAPVFDEGLSSYYQWLFNAVATDNGAKIVVTALALAGLPLSASELAEVFPLLGDVIPAVLSMLSPVLAGEVTTDEVRVYHESFQRFVAAKIEKTTAREEMLAKVISWLGTRDFFEDRRAFRRLIPSLHDGARYAGILELCGPDFVTNAVACGQPGDAVMTNLAIAAQAARELGSLPDLVRVVELNRSADYAYNWALNDDDLAPLYAKAFMALHDAESLSRRLLDEGQRTFHPRVAIMFCGLCDQAGVIPDWQPHLGALERFRIADKHTVYTGGEHNVESARLTGELRLAAEDDAQLLMRSWLSEDQDSPVHPYSPATIYARVFGTQALLCVIELLAPGPNRDWALLAAAASCDDKTMAEQLVAEAIAGGIDDAAAIRLALQIHPAAAELFVRQDIHQLTSQVNDERGHLRTEEALADWFAQLDIAAALVDHACLRHTESLLKGPGWYRRWLRFAVRVRLRPNPADVLDELRALSTDIDLYEGNPALNRLYFAYGQIERSLREALELMDDAHFRAAAEALFTLSENVTIDPTVRFGPLVLDDVLTILLSTSDTDTKCAAASELSTARVSPEELVGGVYSTHATNQLLLARLQVRAGLRGPAQQAWLRACNYLCASGDRRDLTVFEISDALLALGAAAPERAIDCIAATQPLVEAVVAHTDRKGTGHALSSWAEDAARLHPAGGMLHVAMRAFHDVPSQSIGSAMAAGFAALHDTVPPACFKPAGWPSVGRRSSKPRPRCARARYRPSTHSRRGNWSRPASSTTTRPTSPRK